MSSTTSAIGITIGLLFLSFSSQTELGRSIVGDFDGNGTHEKAKIEDYFSGQKGNGEDQLYIAAQRKVVFSSKVFPNIDIGSANFLLNIGDINQNATDEILIIDGGGLEPFDSTYKVYTFAASKKGWLVMLNTSPPTNRYNDPKKWVYRKNDTIFYRTSILKQDLTPKDTVRCIVN